MSVSEKELIEKAVAPRVTLAAVEDNIIDQRFFTAYEGALGERFNHSAGEIGLGKVDIPDHLKVLTFCVLTLRNGFLIVGQSSCAAPENYDQDIGNRLAREDAVGKIWAFMGYELKSYLQILNSETALDESLTRMTAMAFGNEKAFRIEDADRIIKHFQGRGETS
jgi:hypothetical protein